MRLKRFNTFLSVLFSLFDRTLYQQPFSKHLKIIYYKYISNLYNIKEKNIDTNIFLFLKKYRNCLSHKELIANTLLVQQFLIRAYNFNVT